MKGKLNYLTFGILAVAVFVGILATWYGVRRFPTVVGYYLIRDGWLWVLRLFDALFGVALLAWAVWVWRKWRRLRDGGNDGNSDPG